MSRIKVMDPLLSSRIAAGEVIERPASVVKELVENSIDAGAGSITVEIERAGSRLIAVTDDGCGMDDEDALLALEQHGTSKLLSENDLDHIMTLGFRGEALPSIASVSRFTLSTCQEGAASGITVECDGEGHTVTRPYGGARGTRIEVRDLFCNLPARKKFLKSPATEEHHIEEIFSMMALAHPEIGFKLLLDGRTAIFSPASGKTEYRLREIFGRNFMDNMLAFDHAEGALHLSGWVGSPGFTRPSRRDQRVFVNSRPVESAAVYRGIRDGYATLAEPGKFHPAVIFIEMPPEEVDVNVHPAKREVRFRSEYTVSRAVSAAVSAALRQMRSPETTPPADDLRLTFDGKLPLSLVLDAAEVTYHPPTVEQPELRLPPKVSRGDVLLRPSPPAGPAETVPPKPPDEPDAEPSPPDEPAVPPPANAVSPLVRPVAPAAFSGNWPRRIIGVIDRTYILAESAAGLVIIDQHAAHERIMFEKIIAQLSSGCTEKQTLLLPETVELPRPLIGLLEENRELFASLGFEIENAGGGTVLVSAVPVTPCAQRPVAEWLTDMLDEILDNRPPSGIIPPEFAARAACRAAVKAHDELPTAALENLLAQLEQCAQGTLCPHGRPTMVEISLRELERRFSRR